ncbi:hypothetical protein [Mucilaginibacter segetis]|uniref:Natural product n=1 Tax=Mucilaginibacter segetis TaxID=2793071 RepID=A0A934PTU9_9SPHI|nr:hypothetical protein [Mucilaginibacter segetis]MBK0378898.1 hypothetical protein [Mucilaginibacter segetis]
MKLSRAEMKNVMGGLRPGDGGVTCTWTWAGGSECASGTTVQSCSDTVENCQTGADNNCDNNDCCTDVDCR